MNSIDFKKNKDAIAKISGLKTIEEGFNFVSGDERKAIQDAATVHIEALNKAKAAPPHADQKQGEVKNMTSTTPEFKSAPVVHKSSVITMRDSQPTRIYFGENGKEVGSEIVK